MMTVHEERLFAWGNRDGQHGQGAGLRTGPYAQGYEKGLRSLISRRRAALERALKREFVTRNGGDAWAHDLTQRAMRAAVAV